MTFPTNTPKLSRAIIAALEEIPAGSQIEWNTARGRAKRKGMNSIGTVEAHDGTQLQVWTIQGKRVKVRVQDVVKVTRPAKTEASRGS